MKLTTTALLNSILFVFIQHVFFSQTNNNCVDYTGIPLTVNNTCINQVFNSANNTDFWDGFSGCNTTDQDDVWGWFTAISTSTSITYTSTTAGSDPIITIFTAICNSNMASIACSDASTTLIESLVLTTVPGQAYKIRIQRKGSDDAMNGNICIFSTTTVPNAGDAPCFASPLTVGSTCNRSYYTNAIATNTGTPGSPGCGYSAPENDVWFSAIMPLSGNLLIDTEASFGGITNAALAIYSGALCTGLTFVSCDQSSSGSNMPQINITPAQITPGETVYIRLWAEAGVNGIVGICAVNSTACGNPLGLLNDFCENPAILTKNAAATFSANTVSFLPDHGDKIDNLVVGCVGGPGNIIVQNNSWYKFVASATSESFSFTYTSCAGVQAVVYEVAKNANGCCTGLTQKSNCISSIPQHPPGSSLITASGLIVGMEYVLMIDGFNGAQCDYTISGWGATGVLPIELTQFMALTFNDKNIVSWKTASEYNNDYFNLYRSFDGANFALLGVVDGAGNSTQLLTYEVPDYDIRFGVTYYQLEQVDFDGKSTKSQVVALNRNSSENGLVNIYPNPTESAITIDIQTSTQDGGMVVIEGVNGALIHQQFIEGMGIHQVNVDMSSMLTGLYFVRYIDAETMSVKSFIKM